MRPGLISPPDLQARLGAVRVLDASWYLPTAGRDARAEWLVRRIPGARFFDLDAASDPCATMPHMLPEPAHFEAVVRDLGISSGDAVVVYDGSGANLSAARCWWMFRAFGHDDVRVLDGGMPAWVREGRPIEGGEPAPVQAGDFVAKPRAARVTALDEMREIVAQRRAQVVDMRSAARFAGDAPEPRAGIRGGHMPGARNVPYDTLVDAEGRVLDPAALRARLAAAGVTPGRPIVATCGSGVSACALLLALHTLGEDDAALYDGSWTEWGGRADTPVATGPAQ